MNLTIKYMTKNDCYNAGRKIKPLGIMLHSTATPGVMKERWFELWNKSYKAGEIDRHVCVHAFVDDTGVLQCLPWDYRGWHAGGSANDTHISFELCEPPGFKYVNNIMTGYDAKTQEPYFRKVWNNAIELCVYLCRLYGFNEQNIICHSEGCKLGIASNHADIEHWIPKHNEAMDTFRAAVKTALKQKEDEYMMQDTFNIMMNSWQDENDPLYKTLDDVPDYWKNDAADLVKAGAIKGDGKYSFGVRQSVLKAVIISKRYTDSLINRT
jgi:N-acetylmuramoyl-L-alanine amidase CwlA